jgi:hypothetical protein
LKKKKKRLPKASTAACAWMAYIFILGMTTAASARERGMKTKKKKLHFPRRESRESEGRPKTVFDKTLVLKNGLRG